MSEPQVSESAEGLAEKNKQAVHLRGTGNTEMPCAVFDHRSISALALEFSVPVRRTVKLEAISTIEDNESS